jgi:hypothetical protein
MGCVTVVTQKKSGQFGCRKNGHFSACPAFVRHWCLLPWLIREAFVRRKARHQFTNNTTGA